MRSSNESDAVRFSIKYLCKRTLDYDKAPQSGGDA